MQLVKFKAYSFEKEHLYRAFIGKSDISDISQIEYIWRYFNVEVSLKPTHIIVESPYLSSSFLYDYANYYAYSHEDIKKDCKRIHFFTCNDFVGKDNEFELFFNNAVTAEDPVLDILLWNDYLGYAVAKPIAAHPVGPIVFKPYPEPTKKGNRFFPAIKKYHIHIGGKHLELESLAVQSQDKNVSACATVSIWCAFQKLSKIFKTPLPSPYEITHAAGSSHLKGRSFPSNGLNISEIADAIAKYGLVCEIIENNFIEIAPNVFLSEVFAYIRLGIPLLLVLNFGESSFLKPSFGKKELHMVTITGYRINDEIEKLDDRNKMILYSEHINNLYVHDDNFGPFCDLKVKLHLGKYVIVENKSWKLDENKPPVTVEKLIIPLRDKIRISFNEVYEFVLSLDKWTEHFLCQKQDKGATMWDIFLEYSNEYKKDAYISEKTTDMKKSADSEIIHTPMPRYIWVAKAFYRFVDPQTHKYITTHLFDIIIDPSGIRYSINIIVMPIFDPYVKEKIFKIRDLPNKDIEKLDINYKGPFNGVYQLLEYFKNKGSDLKEWI